ncbi:hypothetical protein VTO73DRAFT_10337 [Trametes versicolor]
MGHLHHPIPIARTTALTQQEQNGAEATQKRRPHRSSALTFESHLRLARPHIRSFMPRMDIPTASFRRRRALSVPACRIGASVAQTLAQQLSSLLQPGWQLVIVALAISVSRAPRSSVSARLRTAPLLGLPAAGHPAFLRPENEGRGLTGPHRPC